MIRLGRAVSGCCMAPGLLLFNGAPVLFDDPTIAALPRPAYGPAVQIMRRRLNATRLAVGDLA